MTESGRTIHSHPPSHHPPPPLPVVNQRDRMDVWVEENLDRIDVVSPVIQRQEYAQVKPHLYKEQLHLKRLSTAYKRPALG